jgi:hypothetical protein
MGRLIVTQFITLDGVVEDPDGSDHTDFGGWAIRHGPQGVAGDKFRLGPILEQGRCCSAGEPGSTSASSGRTATTTSPRP